MDASAVWVSPRMAAAVGSLGLPPGSRRPGQPFCFVFFSSETGVIFLADFGQKTSFSSLCLGGTSQLELLMEPGCRL
jgi:hypothetical protein